MLLSKLIIILENIGLYCFKCGFIPSQIFSLFPGQSQAVFSRTDQHEWKGEISAKFGFQFVDFCEKQIFRNLPLIKNHSDI